MNTKLYLTVSEALQLFESHKWYLFHFGLDKIAWKKQGKYSTCYAEYKETLKDDWSNTYFKSQPIVFTRELKGTKNGNDLLSS